MNVYSEASADDRRRQRYDALCELLALPDPGELAPRRHHATCEGDASRRDRTKREFAAAYVQHRLQDHADDSAIVSVRRSPLRLVKRSAQGAGGAKLIVA